MKIINIVLLALVLSITNTGITNLSHGTTLGTTSATKTATTLGTTDLTPGIQEGLPARLQASTGLPAGLQISAPGLPALLNSKRPIQEFLNRPLFFLEKNS